MITRYKRNKFLTLLKQELDRKRNITYRVFCNAVRRVEIVTGIIWDEMYRREWTYRGVQVCEGLLQSRDIPIFCPICHEEWDWHDGDGMSGCNNCSNAGSSLRILEDLYLTGEGRLNDSFRRDWRLFHPKRR
jgi:hypothetical protein